jgi:hypothetical protein
MAFARFAYDRSGSVIVCADERELLAYSGADEHPMWRHPCDSPVVAVGTTVGEVVSLEAAGRLRRFEASSGAKLDGVELGAPARGLAVARDGTCAALLQDEVATVAGGKLGKRHATPGATLVAISDDGTLIAIGGSGGRVRILDARTGAENGTSSVTGELNSICWNVRGFWLLIAGDQVFRVGAGGGDATPVFKLPAGQLANLASSADGGLLACQLGAHEVQVFALPQVEAVAKAVYTRPVEGIEFGPDVWLGIGLDQGDGNKINLGTGACHRTDTHPGRAHHAWEVQLQIDKQKVKEGRSTANPSADAVRAKLAARAAPPKSARPSLPYIIGLIAFVAVCLGGVAFLAHSCGR